jgi:uncharacterized membrane protein YraQ (UPF0718 family)
MDLSEFFDLFFGGYNLVQKGLVFFTIIALIILYILDPAKGVEAASSTVRTLISIIVIIVAGTALGGIIHVAVPKDLIARAIGEESGLRGILLATFLGGLMPGGPYVVYPVLASLYVAGADLPPIISFIFAWSTIALGRTPFELAFFSHRIILLRILVGIPLPILAGYLARLYISIYSI